MAKVRYEILANNIRIADDSGLGSGITVFDADLNLDWKLDNTLSFSMEKTENNYYDTISLYDTITVRSILYDNVPNADTVTVVFVGYVDSIETNKDLIKKVNVIGGENILKYIFYDTRPPLQQSVIKGTLLNMIISTLNSAYSSGSDFRSLWPNNTPPATISLSSNISSSFLQQYVSSDDYYPNSLYNILNNVIAPSSSNVKILTQYQQDRTIKITLEANTSGGQNVINSTNQNIKDINIVDGYGEYFNVVMPYSIPIGTDPTTGIPTTGAFLTDYNGFMGANATEAPNDTVITDSRVTAYPGQYCRRGKFIYSKTAFDRGEKPAIKLVEVDIGTNLKNTAQGWRLLTGGVEALSSVLYIRNLQVDINMFNEGASATTAVPPTRWLRYIFTASEIGATAIVTETNSLNINLFSHNGSKLSIGKRPEPITKRIEQKR